MSEIRREFYAKGLKKFFVADNPSILVCGGGPFDKEVISSCGFRQVTISNLDSRLKGNEFAPYKWAFENAEALSFPDNSFDYVVIHAAIHHASSPHRLLTEMYRVAKKGVFAIESRDSLVMQLFERFELTQVYEHAAVYYNNFKFGGVNNTHIPNYVYRWTEREVEKTINTYAPYARHKFAYMYATSFPVSAQLEKGGMLKYLVLKIAQPLFWLFTKLFKRQQNLFGFYIEKPTIPNDLHPWLLLSQHNEIIFNESWGHSRYKDTKPVIK